MGSVGAVRIRPVSGDADLANWVATYNRASPCRPEGVEYTRHAWSIADERCAYIADVDGRPVGVAHVELDVWTPGTRHAAGMVVVDPAHRHAGVGTALHRTLCEWARARDRDGLDVWCDAAAAPAMRFWARRGHIEVGRERLSCLDLSGAPAAAVTPPAGIALVSLSARDGLERGMYEVGREAITDIPGPDEYDPGDLARLRHGELGWPGLLRDVSVVALAGDRVVGYATLVAFEARPGWAEHEMTAVARDWRGRGLATAMKRQAIANARAAGLTMLEAMNEARNTPMLTVNERLGYRPVTAWVQLRGPLAVG